MLVHPKKLIQDAQKNHYAIGAFNTSNLEITQAIIRAAERKKAPVIIQITENSLKYAGAKPLIELVKNLAEESFAKIGLHMDHAKSYKSAIEGIDAGFSSVLMDGSGFSLDKNIEITKKVVEYARDKGVWVQGEPNKTAGSHCGTSSSGEISEMGFTAPEGARNFVEETGVDTLAVSIGNAHGFYKDDDVKLHIDILREIKKLVKIPLVMHGGSGIPDAEIRKAISAGICVINIDSEICRAFANSLKNLFENKSYSEIDPRKILSVPRDAAQKVVEEKIELFKNKQ
ncbi:MAG: class II fructose-bisphosphate aldolase [bacterium]